MSKDTFKITLNIKNQKVEEELKKIIIQNPGLHFQLADDSASFDLLILEIGDDVQKDFLTIHDILQKDAQKEVFLTSSRQEAEILIQALRAGAKEFFSQPINTDDVKNALLKFKERKQSLKAHERPGKRGNIIDVLGSKGGVGATTVAVNLADSLIRLKEGSRVALIDMNLLFGEIPLFLNLKPNFNWEEVVRNIARLDSTYLMSILCQHSSGIYVLPSPTSFIGMNSATPAIIQKLLQMMQTTFDYIVIDSGQSLDDISMKILEIADTVLLVAILSVPCLINIKRLQENFITIGYPRDEKVKVLISRYHKKSTISLKEAEQSINKKVFGYISNDYMTTMSAINQGKTIHELTAGSEIAQDFKQLVSTLFQGEMAENKKIAFWKRGS